MGLGKQGQGGAAPLDPPLRARPLEPISLRFSEGVRQSPMKRPERTPSENLEKLKGSGVRDPSGGPGGSAPWPYFLTQS